MANYPNRCQHIKVNGTQCGSPALRRNRLCFFHKRFRDERIRLSTDRARRGVATFVLPVLEDANSIQMAIMQVIRLLVSGQMEHKTASLLLYALQTASSNLRMAKFSPDHHHVILDPRDAVHSRLDSSVWDDDDFEMEEEEEEEEQLDEVEAAAQKAAVAAAAVARIRAKEKIEERERAAKREKTRKYLEEWSEEHPGSEAFIDENGRFSHRPKKPAASITTEQVRAEITGIIHEKLPAIAKACPDLLEEQKKLH